jgi:hypothetical protein
MDKNIFSFGVLGVLTTNFAILEHMKVTQVCKIGHMNFLKIFSAFGSLTYLLTCKSNTVAFSNNLAFCFCACLQLRGSELCKSQI